MRDKDHQNDIIQLIYDLVKLIPVGRVSTYGAIANAIGIKSGARYVGYLMNLSHAYSNIPAHRVVNRVGLLTGKHHFGSGDEMKILLEQEGVKVIDDKVLDFQEKFWDPMLEL